MICLNVRNTMECTITIHVRGKCSTRVTINGAHHPKGDSINAAYSQTPGQRGYEQITIRY